MRRSEKSDSYVIPSGRRDLGLVDEMNPESVAPGLEL
jgi:hypothetical protein